MASPQGQALTPDSKQRMVNAAVGFMPHMMLPHRHQQAIGDVVQLLRCTQHCDTEAPANKRGCAASSSRRTTTADFPSSSLDLSSPRLSTSLRKVAATPSSRGAARPLEKDLSSLCVDVIGSTPRTPGGESTNALLSPGRTRRLITIVRGHPSFPKEDNKKSDGSGGDQRRRFHIRSKSPLRHLDAESGIKLNHPHSFGESKRRGEGMKPRGLKTFQDAYEFFCEHRGKMSFGSPAMKQMMKILEMTKKEVYDMVEKDTFVRFTNRADVAKVMGKAAAGTTGLPNFPEAEGRLQVQDLSQHSRFEIPESAVVLQGLLFFRDSMEYNQHTSRNLQSHLVRLNDSGSIHLGHAAQLLTPKTLMDLSKHLPHESPRKVSLTDPGLNSKDTKTFVSDQIYFRKHPWFSSRRQRISIPSARSELRMTDTVQNQAQMIWEFIESSQRKAKGRYCVDLAEMLDKFKIYSIEGAQTFMNDALMENKDYRVERNNNWILTVDAAHRFINSTPILKKQRKYFLKKRIDYQSSNPEAKLKETNNNGRSDISIIADGDESDTSELSSSVGSSSQESNFSRQDEKPADNDADRKNNTNIDRGGLNLGDIADLQGRHDSLRDLQRKYLFPIPKDAAKKQRRTRAFLKSQLENLKLMKQIYTEGEALLSSERIFHQKLGENRKKIQMFKLEAIKNENVAIERQAPESKRLLETPANPNNNSIDDIGPNSDDETDEPSDDQKTKTKAQPLICSLTSPCRDPRVAVQCDKCNKIYSKGQYMSFKAHYLNSHVQRLSLRESKAKNWKIPFCLACHTAFGRKFLKFRHKCKNSKKSRKRRSIEESHSSSKARSKGHSKAQLAMDTVPPMQIDLASSSDGNELKNEESSHLSCDDGRIIDDVPESSDDNNHGSDDGDSDEEEGHKDRSNDIEDDNLRRYSRRRTKPPAFYRPTPRS
eukprot:jgi/Bigna1/81211/fgenesh1_pg.78_\